LEHEVWFDFGGYFLIIGTFARIFYNESRSHQKVKKNKQTMFVFAK